jgi:S-adenosylmethionine hydrolase
MLSIGQAVARSELPRQSLIGVDWDAELTEVIYIDHFGNAMTGMRSDRLGTDQQIAVNGQVLRRASTYDEVARGEGFWYANSCGLIEIAVNQGSAAEHLSLSIGTDVSLLG